MLPITGAAAVVLGADDADEVKPAAPSRRWMVYPVAVAAVLAG